MRVIVRIIFSLLLTISSFAQTSDKNIGVHDFSGGLNVVDNMFLIKENQAQVCTNALLDSLIGGIIRRPGWEYITTSGYAPQGDTSFPRTIFPFIDAAGNSFLLSTRYKNPTVEDNIYYNTNDSFGPIQPLEAFQQSITFSLFPGVGNWVTWNGRAFYFDGHSTGKVLYHGKENDDDELSIDFAPPPAPGQPLVKPYKDGPAGPQNGEYVYALMVDVPCSTAYHWGRRCGTLTPPIKLNKERALITGFPFEIDDTLCAADANARIAICRTLANRYGPNDTLYVVDTIVDNSPWNEQFIDTMSDATLGVAGKVVGRIGILAYGELDKSDESTPCSLSQTSHYYFRNNYNKAAASGSPLFLRGNDGNIGGPVGDTVNGYKDGDGNLFINGYAVAWYNSHTLMESDTSRSLWIDLLVGIDTMIKISLPKLPVVLSDYNKIIYRAMMGYENIDFCHPVYYDFIPIDTVPGTTTTYTDKFSFTKIDSANDPYVRQVLDQFIKGAIIHEARMFAWTDDRIYISIPESTKFISLENYEIDLFDGDKVQGLQSFAGHVLTYKTNSLWSLFTQDGIVYDRKKRLQGLGAVGPKAFSQWNGNAVFLSKQGIYMASEGQYKDNYLEQQHISREIDPLLLRSPEDMEDILLFVKDNKLLVSIPETDTTFVYHFLTGGWSDWSFSMGDAAVYDTLKEAPFFENMVFCELSKGQLRRQHPTLNHDNSVAIPVTWEKKYMGFEPGMMKIPEFLDVYGDSANMLHWTPTITNEANQIFTGWGISLSSYDSPTEYWHFPVSQANYNSSHWFNVKFVYNTINPANMLYGFDILTTDVGLTAPNTSEE